MPVEFAENARACVAGIPGNNSGSIEVDMRRTASPMGPFHLESIADNFDAAYVEGNCEQ